MRQIQVDGTGTVSVFPCRGCRDNDHLPGHRWTRACLEGNGNGKCCQAEPKSQSQPQEASLSFRHRGPNASDTCARKFEKSVPSVPNFSMRQSIQRSFSFFSVLCCNCKLGFWFSSVSLVAKPLPSCEFTPVRHCSCGGFRLGMCNFCL